ncbi:MAG: PqqD family protein [Clostridia bacterium]|nr:PqqD family protein [Clostridia bacterium]
MNVKSDYVLREIAGDWVLVPTGTAAAKYNGLFAVTEVGARIIELLPECPDEEHIVSKILEEYDIDDESARRDVAEFMSQLREHEMIEE